MCRFRREPSNAYFLAKFGFDTAENEPCQVCPIEQCSGAAIHVLPHGPSECCRKPRGSSRRSRRTPTPRRSRRSAPRCCAPRSGLATSLAQASSANYHQRKSNDLFFCTGVQNSKSLHHNLATQNHLIILASLSSKLMFMAVFNSIQCVV